MGIVDSAGSESSTIQTCGRERGITPGIQPSTLRVRFAHSKLLPAILSNHHLNTTVQIYRLKPPLPEQPKKAALVKVAESEGFEPSMGVKAHTPLAGERLQPLGQLSKTVHTYRKSFV